VNGNQMWFFITSRKVIKPRCARTANNRDNLCGIYQSICTSQIHCMQARVHNNKSVQLP